MQSWAKWTVSAICPLSLTHANKVPATLRLAEHVTNLYLHEIALHRDQGAADLQPPFLDESMSVDAKKNGPIGPSHISALGECLTSTHGILDTILSIPLDILLTLPVIFCERHLSTVLSFSLIDYQVFEQFTPLSV
jgi:hypothetical protein